MSDDPILKMYEAQAELLETKETLEMIQKENDELKNQVAANNLMKTVDNFQRNNSNRFETIEENLRRLTTTVSNSHNILAEIKESLKDLKEKMEVQKEKEKNLVDDHAKLSETVGAIQTNLNALSTKFFTHDQILSEIDETLRKQNDALEKQKDIQVLKRDKKTTGNQRSVFSISFPDKETILLLGGRSRNKIMDSLVILQNNEDNDGNWKKLNIKLPYAVGGHGAQFLNNCLYIFGGRNEKKEVLNSSYKLRKGHEWLTHSLQWEKITDMNERRKNISNSSVILNYRIWVIGGCNERNKALKSVEMYDPQRNIWKNMKEMNECRSVAAAAVVRGKIFCCGGETGGSYSKTTECYDFFSDVWTLISDMAGPNGECGTVVMDGHLVIIGGKASLTDFLNSVWVLDTTNKNGKWIEKEPCPSRPLCQFSTAKIDDKIFVCGGVYMDQKDSKRYNTSEVEIFDGNVWRNGPSLPDAQDCAATVVIPMEFARYLK